MKGNSFVLGREVDLFEEELAAHLGVPEVVGVGNGTDALRLGLLAAGVSPGDEVITVSHTAIATVAAIHSIGAVPVLVDVNPDDMTIDPSLVEAAISDQSSAVVAVHLYGQPVDLTSLQAICRRFGLALIEDVAQAQGATYFGKPLGTFGDLAAFSFYPTKNLGAVGDGGAIATNDPEVAASVRRLRQYGWDSERRCVMTGFNSRLDELQAAVLRVKLRSLDASIKRRQKHAIQYANLLDSEVVTPQKVRENSTHGYHLYVVRSSKREFLSLSLSQNGVKTGIHYAIPAHLQPAYSPVVRVPESLHVTEMLAKEVLSLPMFPSLHTKSIRKVCDVINATNAARIN